MVESKSVEDLLEDVRKERLKFTLADNSNLNKLVAELVAIGEYPAESKMGVPAQKMVQYYGAYWHKYKEPFECRHCKGELRDLENGPPFKLEIGMIENDSCAFFFCPHCRETL